ncbi:unnamed protein product [Rotaria sp. Silwood2]|nr:unnamed protein product [Rotaria sp. Silwood2]
MVQTPSTTDLATTTDAPSSVPSEFYLACHNGEAKKVKRMLPQMNTADINSRTPNGSTSLHDASFYGHKTIVKMLLANGAQPWIINKYKNMPYEEATNDEIRSLFLHRCITGESYRGLSMITKDIDEYKLAVDNQGTLIEIKPLTSTSVNPEVA